MCFWIELKSVPWQLPPLALLLSPNTLQSWSLPGTVRSHGLSPVPLDPILLPPQWEHPIPIPRLEDLPCLLLCPALPLALLEASLPALNPALHPLAHLPPLCLVSAARGSGLIGFGSYWQDSDAMGAIDGIVMPFLLSLSITIPAHVLLLLLFSGGSEN